jgi:hypothetical protein
MAFKKKVVEEVVEPVVVEEVVEPEPAAPTGFIVNLTEAFKFCINGVEGSCGAGEQEVTAAVYDLLKNTGRI